MTTVTFESELKRVGWLLDHGVLGDECDYDALSEHLTKCKTVEDLAAFRRMALRWHWATSPIEPWVEWQDALSASAN